MNYFEFYDLVPCYSIDTAALKKLYYSKMRSYHPDMHIGSDSDKQAKIMELSSFNNAAFKTLQDDHLRLKYLVDTYSNKANSLKLPQAFLMEMMDINEDIMEVSMQGNTQSVLELKSKIQEQQEELFEELKPILETCSDFRKAEHKELEAIQNYLLKRNYLLRLIEQLEQI